SLVVVIGLGILVDELVWLAIDKKHFSFIGYPWNKSDEEFDFSVVDILVKEEYRERYNQRGFTVEDLEWDNVEKIEYWAYGYETDGNRFLRIVVYLKKAGSKNCRRACLHFNKLDFVDFSREHADQTVC
ncbi:MAG: hypothetical protein PUK12_04600, partial [Clostridiales bacterium]|nr:hypothetical protein [Clostridiales bacterium]MDY5726191.1 hypothetical protein [Eubacteriales bacterium]